MDLINTPSVLIALAAIVIVSYLFNLLAKKTRIPSAFMLLAMAIILRGAASASDFEEPNVVPLLEVLGSVGLIMIVLEAALDLKLTRQNRGMIGRTFLVTIIELSATTAFLAAVFHIGMNAPWVNAIVYAVPLSILSSAIIIPSVENCAHKVKEFMIYQSTFSDIIGIMFFYFLVEGFSNPVGGTAEWLIQFGWTFGVSIIISAVFAYLLVLLLKNIKTQLKLFLLISVLILLYAVGKLFHISSLLIILIFGLILNNPKTFFFGPLQRWLKEDVVASLLEDFRIITRETAFIVQTFFFVVFGFSLDLMSLANPLVIFYALIALVGIFRIRGSILGWSERKPEPLYRYMAPRGLITILLFYSIPKAFHIPAFDNGILLYIILASSIYMAWGMVRNRSKDDTSSMGDVLRSSLGMEAEDVEDEDETPYSGA